MHTTLTWLDEISRRREDHDWLASHESELLSAIREAVYFPPLLHRGVDALLQIHPYLLKTTDLNPWMDVLYHALIEMMNLRDGDRLTGLWGKMGESFHQIDHAQQAIAAFHNQLGRAEERQNAVEILTAYIGLFKAQMFRQDARFSDEMVSQAINLSKTVDDLGLQAALYQAIAFAHSHRGENVAALGFGQTAYACWRKLGNTHEMARTVFALAADFYALGGLEQAHRCLELAKTLYLATDDPRQYPLIAYQQAVLNKKQGNYRAAEQWSALALQEFNQLKPPHYRLHYVAAAHHALGIIQVLLNDYDKARINLETALSMWVQLGDRYEQAHVFHDMGYLEGQMGNIQAARDWLEKGLQTCAELPETPARDQLQQLLQATTLELDDTSISK